jgi:ABC-type spermidine/putrescine transport system permease subunit II
LAGSTQTLPLYIYTQLRTEVSPTVNAIGTLIVAAAMASILTVQLVQAAKCVVPSRLVRSW